MNNSNKEIKNCNTFLEYINQELCMYDDLSRNQHYKKDREIAKNKYDALFDLKNKFKEIYKD